MTRPQNRFRSLNGQLLAMLAVAVVAALLCFFGGRALGEWATDTWYLSERATAKRSNLLAERLQQYVTAHDIPSWDLRSLELWAKEEDQANILVYQGDDLFEIAWWGSSPLTQEELELGTPEEWGYHFHDIAFSNGVQQVAVGDTSELILYDLSAYGALILAFLVFAAFLLRFTRRITNRISTLSAEVNAVSGGALEHSIVSRNRDEIGCLARDVDRMRDTIILRARSEQSALQANSELITALSHDIRNPLTSLIGYLELLEMEQGTMEDAREYVRSSLDKAYRIRDLTGEMFRYFLVFGQEAQDVQMEEYDAQILLEQLLWEYAEELRMRGFTVHCVTLETPCTVRTDVGLFKRVLDNLVSNVDKYADPEAAVVLLAEQGEDGLHICLSNRIRKPLPGAVESNHVGLRTCEAILKLLEGTFQCRTEDDTFTAECVLPLT